MNQTDRPNFNRIYTSEWEYDRSLGVGLRMTGYPNNVERFNEILMGCGCHPVAVQRILSRILEKGYDLLTVQSTLHFDTIEELLQPLEMKMEIIPPQEGWTERFDDGAWPYYPKNIIC